MTTANEAKQQAWGAYEDVIRGGFDDDHEGDFNRAFTSTLAVGHLAAHEIDMNEQIVGHLTRIASERADFNAPYRPGIILGVVAALNFAQNEGGRA